MASRTFSQEMVIATLDYAGSHVSAILHQFTLIRILDCRKEDVYRYQHYEYKVVAIRKNENGDVMETIESDPIFIEAM